MTTARRYQARRRALRRAAFKQHDLEWLWIGDPADVRYLTGCTEGALGLLLGPDDSLILASRMYQHVIPLQAPGCAFEICKKVPERLAEILQAARYRGALGLQGGHLTWAALRQFKETLKRRPLVDVGDLARRLRAVKDAEEIALTHDCVRIAESAFRGLCACGPTYLREHAERELAAELEYRMRALGADRQGFGVNGIIVASGPNSANCHHMPTDRRAQPGEPLLFDWGAEKAGYRSDITRVVFPGAPTAAMQKLFRVVQRANHAGVAAIRAGAACRTVAAAGWQPVRDAGHGAQIRHGLGHGVGLQIHEYPGFGMGEPETEGGGGPRLKANMIVTIEPGIYLVGEGGVRIEDDVLVTPRGGTRLTSLPVTLKAAVLTG